ncbi:hypothetical protein KIN20_022366 [Parelaphostrongylus tenuis]|uniref:Uncharacterized protein n=1 Tax=Parelaphostrongylus tenuis TaxID=148309 RepID=A0AAD5QUQ6_PARTN|nr:hypothetical protein KIN20_022366 [Parelaphostrongylus tenuis]
MERPIRTSKSWAKRMVGFRPFEAIEVKLRKRRKRSTLMNHRSHRYQLNFRPKNAEWDAEIRPQMEVEPALPVPEGRVIPTPQKVSLCCNSLIYLSAISL